MTITQLSQETITTTIQNIQDFIDKLNPMGLHEEIFIATTENYRLDILFNKGEYKPEYNLILRFSDTLELKLGNIELSYWQSNKKFVSETILNLLSEIPYLAKDILKLI